MSSRTLKESAQALAYRTILSYLDSNPDENLPKLVDWLEAHDKQGALKNQLRGIKPYLYDGENNWNRLMKSLWTDIDPFVRRRLLETFVINGSLLGNPRQNEYRDKYDCNVPWAILMDPTSACNLKCTGCWAAEYGNRLNLTLDELDSIIEQGKEMGTYVYIYSGGEPLVRKKDILELCEKHPECAFLAFTNGTLIDEQFADDMLRVGNFVPAISVEGFEADTDFRRGKGTFQAVLRAMEILKRKKLPFGLSCCYTSKNAEMIGSEEYFDAMIDWGAKFCWFFTYMPIGKDAVPELMATAQQREYMYHQIRKFRKTKPLFTLDFWNDGEYVGGCIAGGRNFLHINAGGDIEPCAFAHYSDSNIREKTLLEAYRSPLFMAYHRNQPFNGNMLRPCPVLDNPGRLTAMVEETGARSTDILAPESAGEYSDKCVSRAAEWAPVANRLWTACGKNCEECAAGCGTSGGQK
ncbi:MAG: radical SAM protein [Clostridiaceae bacterium]|nr:radical SAM protein [Clostridiaceae bacterium]